jgi:hypothetical protein
MAIRFQKDAIKKYCDENEGWIPAYDLIKVELYGKWVGSSGDSTARDMFAEGLILREKANDLISNGIKVDYKGRKIESPYVYYASVRPKKKKYYYNPETGEPMRDSNGNIITFYE